MVAHQLPPELAGPPPEVVDQEYEADVHHSRLELHPANPRQGDLDAIARLIHRNGFVGSLGVQRSSGCIVWGNHRFQAGRSLGMETFPVTWLDVDDETAVTLLLADNAASDAAANDPAQLAHVLQAIASERAPLDAPLEATGHTLEGLNALLASLAPPTGSDGGDDDAPEFGATGGDGGAGRDPARQIVVMCTPQEHAELAAGFARIRAAHQLPGPGAVLDWLLDREDAGA